MLPSVIYQCGLQHDLTLFDAGDETEVGEKGLTLRYAQPVEYCSPRHKLFQWRPKSKNHSCSGRLF